MKCFVYEIGLYGAEDAAAVIDVDEDLVEHFPHVNQFTLHPQRTALDRGVGIPNDLQQLLDLSILGQLDADVFCELDGVLQYLLQVRLDILRQVKGRLL